VPVPGKPPPRKQLIRNLMWVRGVVCRSTRTQSLTVVASVILQCIPYFHECAHVIYWKRIGNVLGDFGRNGSILKYDCIIRVSRISHVFYRIERPR
jgi:hypothetical protein